VLIGRNPAPEKTRINLFHMRLSLLLFVCAFSTAYAQVRQPSSGETVSSNLPMQTIGANDLVAISVYDSPELTRTVRVSAEGFIRLPMLAEKIKAQGLMPSDLEVAIANALTSAEVLVQPVVTVTIAEYHSRPISVMGSVKKPTTFQATAPVTLLDALARAEGLTIEAGPVILLTRGQPKGDGTSETSIQRISVEALIGAADPEMNVMLTGGEEILVPPMGRVFVMGNVKRPGAFSLREGGEGTVLQMLALAEGLAPFSGKKAYLYRRAKDGSRTEVAVELEAILKRKNADVAVLPEDILYVPDNKARRLTATALERILSFGSTAGATALVYGGR
jgi:polysaccharide export outer membrane protein